MKKRSARSPAQEATLLEAAKALEAAASATTPAEMESRAAEAAAEAIRLSEVACAEQLAVEAAAEAEADRLAAEEGLCLLRAPTTGGYKGVKRDKNLSTRPFYAQLKQNGQCKSLGYFVTAKEAALAYARAKGQKACVGSSDAPSTSEEATEQTELTESDRCAAAEGLELVRAPGSSGYKGVKHHKDHRHRLRPYEARTWVDGKTKSLGRFSTAKEAALAYARAKAHAPPPIRPTIGRAD